MKKLIVAFTLGISIVACQTTVEKYDYRGSWQAKCSDGSGRTVMAQFEFKNGKFTQKIQERFFPTVHSGIYNATRNEINLTYIRSDRVELLHPQYKNATKKIKWLDKDTFEYFGGGVSCITERISSQYTQNPN